MSPTYLVSFSNSDGKKYITLSYGWDSEGYKFYIEISDFNVNSINPYFAYVKYDVTNQGWAHVTWTLDKMGLSKLYVNGTNILTSVLSYLPGPFDSNMLFNSFYYELGYGTYLSSLPTTNVNIDEFYYFDAVLNSPILSLGTELSVLALSYNINNTIYSFHSSVDSSP